MERFSERKSLAGILHPGDATRYEMVAVEDFGVVRVAVLNEEFGDIITFLIGQEEPYTSTRGLHVTNPWTVKAAKEMRDMLLCQS